MKRSFSAMIAVLLGGCAAMDSLDGMRRFASVTDSDKVEFHYVEGGPDTAFFFNGVKVGTLAFGEREDYVTNQYNAYHAAKSLGNSIVDSSWGGWAGIHEGRFLIAECQITSRQSGERDCFLKQLERCQWMKWTKPHSCHVTAHDFASASVVRSVKLGPLPALKRLTHRELPSGVVEFGFDGAPFHFESYVDFYSKPRNKRLVYSGPLGPHRKAELYCRLDTKYGKVGPVGDYVFCEAYKDVWRDSNLISNLLFYPNKTIASNARAIASRYYRVQRWPLLDSRHKSMVPFPVETRSEAGELLQTEWKKWTEN